MVIVVDVSTMTTIIQRSVRWEAHLAFRSFALHPRRQSAERIFIGCEWVGKRNCSLVWPSRHL